ncbi:MAG: nucleotidyltransferase domain-containing protein [Rhodothermales bacterium]
MQPQIAQEPVYASIVETLRAAVPGLIAIYLFGSAARGQRRQESDVDVAVLATHPLAPETRWTLQERLADQLHSDVDLVDLRAASTVMRAQVLASDRVLYEADTNVRQRFEMHALSMYADLNETRAAILEDIHQRGQVYGG